MWRPTRILDPYLIMLTSSSLLSCTILRPVVAGLSQAFPVFNLSYGQLSLRLDLLYQYQAIASEVPCDRYMTNFLYLWTINPQADCLTSWIPLSHTRCHDFVHLEMRQAGLTNTWLTLTWTSLLTRIWLRLHLELGHNTFAVTKLLQHAANPTKEHLNKALYICHYLLESANYAMVLNGPSNGSLMAYADSDWASNPNTYKSTTGYMVKLTGAVFS